MLQLPANVEFILNMLNESGYEAYVVGGCVRDALRGQQPHDWDVCTSCLPEEAVELFEALGYPVLKTGLKHGTITILMDGEGYEVTTFRTDGDYSDHRRPDAVHYTESLLEDLSRRDFTINAMAYNPVLGFVDYYGGQADLEQRVIRCVGDPGQRFNEDALRILRALRFSAVFGYGIDPATENSIRLNKLLLHEISGERIRDELCKILVTENPARLLRRYVDIFSVVIPEMEACIGFRQNNPYHLYDVWEHTLCALEESPNDLWVRLTLLFHDIGKPLCYTEDENGVGHFYGHPAVSEQMTRARMRALRFSNREIDTVSQLVRHHDDDVQLSTAYARKLLNRLGGFEQARRLIDVKKADVSAQDHALYHQRTDKLCSFGLILRKIEAESLAFTIKDLAIDGHDLMGIGYEVGPGIGQMLKRLLDEVISGDLPNTKTALIAYAAKHKE